MASEIVTERLRLVPLSIKDAEELFHIRSFEEVYKNFMSAPWQHLGQSEEWIRKVTAGPRSFVFRVELKDPSPEDPIQGMIGVLGINTWDTLAYLFHPEAWGKGYCTEALQAFIPALFNAQKRTHLEAGVQEDNFVSRRVLEKCGFQRNTPGSAPQSAREPHPEPGGTKAELTSDQETDLRKSILGLDLQTEPLVAPIRPEESEPQKKAGLIGYILNYNSPFELNWDNFKDVSDDIAAE